jgi:hypothetical protein
MGPTYKKTLPNSTWIHTKLKLKQINRKEKKRKEKKRKDKKRKEKKRKGKGKGDRPA